MVSRINDYSFLDDDTIKKIASVIEDDSKVVQIVDNEKEATILQKQLNIQGYNTKIEKHGKSFHVIAKPRDMILYHEAIKSGQFTKLAFGRYSFTRQSNNPLGIQHYNFDEGTIWKVMTGKDGKEYLVKEVDDDNEELVVRKSEKSVLAESSLDVKSLKKICKVLYDNPSDEFINDLFDKLPSQMNKILTAKLDKLINDNVKASKFISSPKYINDVKTKVITSINQEAIFNKEQISKFILSANRELLNQ